MTPIEVIRHFEEELRIKPTSIYGAVAHLSEGTSETQSASKGNFSWSVNRQATGKWRAQFEWEDRPSLNEHTLLHCALFWRDGEPVPPIPGDFLTMLNAVRQGAV